MVFCCSAKSDPDCQVGSIALSCRMSLHRMGIIGLGNSLAGDDGAGVWVAEELQKKRPDSWICALGADMLRVQARAPYPASLIIIDSVRTGAARAGTLHRLTDEEVLAGRRGVGPHDLGPVRLLEILLAHDSQFAASAREWIVVEALDLSRPFLLTPPVALACRALVEELLERLTDSESMDG